MKPQNFRTGFGYDVHRLVRGRKLILGGVEIPASYGLTGHSDADVLLHAVCDAILGAAGYADIGNQFPNTDMKYKDISSLTLLKECYKLLKKKDFRIVNIDCMVILESPKIYKYVEMMKINISAVLKTKNISIKATTSEGLGFVGQGKGCVAYCTALIYK